MLLFISTIWDLFYIIRSQDDWRFNVSGRSLTNLAFILMCLMASSLNLVLQPTLIGSLETISGAAWDRDVLSGRLQKEDRVMWRITLSLLLFLTPTCRNSGTKTLPVSVHKLCHLRSPKFHIFKFITFSDSNMMCLQTVLVGLVLALPNFIR